MPFPLIPLALSALGGFFGNKSKSSTTPQWPKEFGPLQQLLMQQIMGRLKGGIDLSGYESGGLQDINRTFDLLGQSQANNLTARGLGTSPVAGNVDAMRENARGGQLARFQSGIPLVRRDLQNQDLGLGLGFLGMGRGSMTEGTSGGGLGGAADSLATYLGYLKGIGAFGGGGGTLPSRQTVPPWMSGYPGTPPYIGNFE